MSTLELDKPQAKATSSSALEEIWFTRCPVPTATGLAYRLGWLGEEFARDGIKVATIQEAPRALQRHHYDHEIPTLIREGGALLALAARAQGSPTRLIGLTWIEEAQAIIVRPDSGIRNAFDLRSRKLALPAFVQREIAAHVRGSSIWRGMSLHGYKGTLASVGLTLDDVTLVEVGSGQEGGDNRGVGNLGALEAVAQGVVDAAYVKGAAAVEAARRLGLVVGIDLDALPERRFRVNNGTPRPITVHEDFLQRHFDVVARFLAQTLRAADWAANNLQGVYDILKGETRAGDEGVSSAYRDGFHQSLHPDLSPDRIELLRRQKHFMLVHGILDADFDLDAWLDPRPLAAARALLSQEGR